MPVSRPSDGTSPPSNSGTHAVSPDATPARKISVPSGARKAARSCSLARVRRNTAGASRRRARAAEAAGSATSKPTAASVGSQSRASCSLQTTRALPWVQSRTGLLRWWPRKVKPSWRSNTSTSPVSSALTSTKSKPAGCVDPWQRGLWHRSLASRPGPASQVRERLACWAVRTTSVWRKVSLKISSDSGSGVPGLQHMTDERGQVERTLAREQPVVPAPREDVHRQRGRVGELEEEDLLAGNLLDRGGVVPAGQDVEAVQAHADRLVVGKLGDPPCVSVVVDVPPPRQGLVGETDAVLGGRVTESAKLGRRHFVVVDRGRGDVAAHEHGVDAQPLHQTELGHGAVQDAGEERLVDALGVAERLVEVQREPEPLGQRPDLVGAGGRGDQVRLEDLDPVEARLGAGVELLARASR